MEQNLLTKKKLKEKSIEYQIPFANLLEGFFAGNTDVPNSGNRFCKAVMAEKP